MAIVADLSGNTPLDTRKGGHYDLPILPWKGAQQLITAIVTSVQSAKFARTARALRIAPIGNIHYEVGTNPTADGTSPFLGGGAVEDVRIKFGERIAIIRHTADGIVTLTEDV